MSELRTTDSVGASDEYETRTLFRTDEKPLAFKGKLLGRANGDRDGGSWYDFVLFETVRGARVGGRRYLTCWEGHDDSYEARVLKSDAECFEFFGMGDQAKELYADAGLVTEEWVE